MYPEAETRRSRSFNRRSLTEEDLPRKLHLMTATRKLLIRGFHVGPGIILSSPPPGFYREGWPRSRKCDDHCACVHQKRWIVFIQALWSISYVASK